MPRGYRIALALAYAAFACTDPVSNPQPTRLAVAVAPTATAPNRAPFATQPEVRLEDDDGNAVARAGIVVSVAITAGSGTLTGQTSAITADNGRATFSDLAIQGTVGPRTLTFTAPSLTSATANLTLIGGAPSEIEVHAGDLQSEAEGIAVPVSPAVRLLDQDGNGSPNVTVTFTVAAGGGSITGATQTTGADGIATVGSWILGDEGPNTLTASAAGLTESPTFTATAIRLPVASVTVTNPSSAALVVGQMRQLSAVARDSVGRPLANRSINWSSDTPDLASVDEGGIVTALLPGTASIVATSETQSAAAPVEVDAPTLPHIASSLLSGHVGAQVSDPPPDFRYGYGFYSSVHVLDEEHSLHTQLGWGSWLSPDNFDFTSPLCPVGTYARDNWEAERAAEYYRGVYQSIEGGVGRWVSTRFPSAISKFRINATPDCYDNQIASGAWSFYGTLLSNQKLGLAQLSNRLLLPPDGITFAQAPGLFGNAWIALPLIPPYLAPSGLPVGDQSWTLFIRASNFSGPVAFYTPETWTRVHLSDQSALGRSHDVRPLSGGNSAMEIGELGYFEGTGPDGTLYRRVPRLSFPLATATETVMAQDLQYFSKQAIWDGVQAWKDAGTVAMSFDGAGIAEATVSGSSFGVRFGSETAAYPPEFSVGAVGTAGGGTALGMTWDASGDFPAGIYPEYYRKTGDTWIAVPPSEVPRTTWLIDQEFPLHPRGALPAVSTSAGSPFHSAQWAAGPFTASISDGSTVEYVWYRFVEQPAIARLGLSPEVLDELQAFVESLHENSGTSGVSIPLPTSGTMVAIDGALIVTPPAGLGSGYVPVVIRQF